MKATDLCVCAPMLTGPFTGSGITTTAKKKEISLLFFSQRWIKADYEVRTSLGIGNYRIVLKNNVRPVSSLESSLKTSDFIENLQWAMDLEEDMAERLVHLCHPETLPQSIADDSRKRIEALLHTIGQDTQRHAKIVSDIVLEMSGKQDNG